MSPCNSQNTQFGNDEEDKEDEGWPRGVITEIPDSSQMNFGRTEDKEGKGGTDYIGRIRGSTGLQTVA